MSLAEVSTLFLRGRAELRGRGAPHASPRSSAAIRERGVDAGVTEFYRFTLGRTTSSNTFEPRFEARFSFDTRTELESAATSSTLERVTALIEQPGFPGDGKRFVGLRGPVELEQPRCCRRSRAACEAGHRAASTPSPAPWIASTATGTSARARSAGSHCRSNGCRCCSPMNNPASRLGLPCRSCRPFLAAQLFATYRFGVEWNYGPTYANYRHPERPPARWVWGPGDIARILGAVLARTLLDQESDAGKPQRGRAPLPATTSQVRLWLTADVDESLFSAWLSRLALFDWRISRR